MVDTFNVILTVLSILPLAFAGLLAVIGVAGGIKRGLRFSLIRLGVILVSFTVSLILSLVLLPVFDGVIADRLTEVLAGIEGFRDLTLEGVTECAGVLTGAVVCPFLFCFIYFCIDLVFHITFHAVTVRLHKEKDRTAPSRAGGAGVGLLSALLVSVLLLSPLAGAAATVTTATDTLRQEEFQFDNAATVYAFGDKLEEISSLAIIRALGGELLYDSLAVIRFEDGAASLHHEIVYVARAVAHGARLGTPLIHYNASQIAALRKLADACDESLLLPHVGGEAVSALAEEMAESGSAMAFVLPDFGPYLSGLFEKGFDILSTTTPALIGEDLRAVADLLEVLVRYEVLINIESDYATLDNIAKPGFAEDLNGVLHAHPRLEPLRDEIGRIALLAIAGAVDAEELGTLETAALDRVAVEITLMLNGAGSEEELATRLNTFLKTADASVDFDASGLTDFVSTTILDRFSGEEYVTAEDLRQLILDYRLELIENGYPVH